MKVLSLFDGMSCGAMAFKKAAIDVERYVAYEIDKYAIKVADYNFPNIEREEDGDVFHADFTKYKGFDALIGGSPCTKFSIARNKTRETSINGVGGNLFLQYYRALKESEPKFFIYENNYSMHDNIKRSISECFGFEPVMINSSLVSGQNRKRYYWVGIRNEDGTYRKANIPQPKDRGIFLKDILEDTSKLVADPVAVAYRSRFDGEKNTKRYESNGNKSNCLTTVRTDSMVAEPIEVVGMKYEVADVNDKDSGVCGHIHMFTTHEMLTRIYCREGKSPTITTCCGGHHQPKVFSKVEDVRTKNKVPIYDVVDGMMELKGKKYPIKLDDGRYIVRKLTVEECKRLQTIPDDYDISIISNSQGYKCIGNGWTVDVIAHIIKCTIDDMNNNTVKYSKQHTIYDEYD